MQTSLTGLPVQTNAVFGYTAGGGVEVALGENWTFKAEYLFVGLNNSVCNHGYSCGFDVARSGGANPIPAQSGNCAIRLNENLVRFGVNFKFGH